MMVHYVSRVVSVSDITQAGSHAGYEARKKPEESESINASTLPFFYFQVRKEIFSGV